MGLLPSAFLKTLTTNWKNKITFRRYLSIFLIPEIKNSETGWRIRSGMTKMIATFTVMNSQWQTRISIKRIVKQFIIRYIIAEYITHEKTENKQRGSYAEAIQVISGQSLVRQSYPWEQCARSGERGFHLGRSPKDSAVAQAVGRKQYPPQSPTISLCHVDARILYQSDR